MTTQELLAICQDRFNYNPETGKITNRRQFRGKVKPGAEAGTINHCGYRKIKINYKRYPAHRIAWLMTYGYMPQKHIDHINRVKDDNRIANLREATPAENGHNTKKPSHNTSGYKGVCWEKKSRKWHARISIDGKRQHIGYYDTAEDAASAYDLAAIELHGDFANTNF